MSSAQRCMVCGEVFGGTTAGDTHRVFDHSYVVARVGGHVRRFDSVEAVPDGGRVLSVGNVVNRCLSVEQMIAKGLRLNARGSWVRPAPQFAPESVSASPSRRVEDSSPSEVLPGGLPEVSPQGPQIATPLGAAA